MHISTAYLLMICTIWCPAGKLCCSLALAVNLLQHAQMDVGHCPNPTPLGACLCGKQYSCFERLVSKPFACKSMTVSKLYSCRTREKKFALCSDHIGGLPRQQPGACIKLSDAVQSASKLLFCQWEAADDGLFLCNCTFWPVGAQDLPSCLRTLCCSSSSAEYIGSNPDSSRWSRCSLAVPPLV